LRTTTIIFLIFLFFPVSSQKRVEPLLFDLQFIEAEKLLSAPGAENAYSYSCPYLKNYLLFLKSLINGDEASYQEYLELSDRYIRQMKELETDEPAWLNMMSQMFFHSSILNMDHNDRWKAIRNYYKAWRVTEYNLEQYPDYVPGLKTRGALELISGSVPADYSWVLRWARIKGSIESGQAKLLEYYRTCSPDQELEASLILTLAYLQFDRDPNAAYEFIETSRSASDTSLFFGYVRALAAMKARHNDEAISILSSLEEKANTRGFSYVNLLMGEAKLNRLDKDAGFYLELFLMKHNGTHYIKTANHKLSWYYLLSDEQELYQEMRERVLTPGMALLEADRQAVREARDATAPVPGLIAARLYHDGGYYEKGIKLLLDHPPSIYTSEKDRAERDYRLARLYHGYGDMEEAVSYYHRVLLYEGEPGKFFAPNSMLQLGIIAEESGQYQRASGWYNSCLAIEKEDHKRGIEMQAESGLRRIAPYLNE